MDFGFPPLFWVGFCLRFGWLCWGLEVSFFEKMIEVKNIIKRYGNLEVLKGVSVTIGDGEIV